jgi:hypothetical protein
MSESFSAILAFLDGHKYQYTSHGGEERVNLTLAGKHADYRVILRVTHGGDFFQIYIHYPFRVRDEAVRASAAELVCRANYGMLVGGFEIDMSDGEIRFHVAHLILGLPLYPETAERLLFTAVSSLDRYFPAFMQHLHAGHTPEDAVYLAEVDIHAASVEEPRKEEKHPPSSPGKIARSRKSRRKGDTEHGGGDRGSQGDLPL